MKSKQAWETFDGKTFFDQKEAEEHEERLRIAEAKKGLTSLLNKTLPTKQADATALHILQNIREFATAISPLITKSVPRAPVNQISRKRTPICRHIDKIHVVDGSSGHWECNSCGADV